MIHVRPAVEADLPAIAEIYNEAILTTTATFDVEPKSLEDRRAWFAAHAGRYPVLVAEESSRILGWASLSPMGSRAGWRFSVEDSVYVRASDRGRSVGRALLERLVAEAQSRGFHAVIARIVVGNEPSVRLHESLGFQPVGSWREVRRIDTWLDLLVMQLLFNPGQPPSTNP